MKVNKVWKFSSFNAGNAQTVQSIQLVKSPLYFYLQFYDGTDKEISYARFTKDELKALAVKMLELANEYETDQPSK